MHGHQMLTRLIDVAPGTVRVNPQIVRTYKMPDQYLALSCCWGAQTFTLTVANDASMMRGFEASMLSLTIQGAIEITKRLIFKYLWVYALCIL